MVSAFDDIESLAKLLEASHPADEEPAAGQQPLVTPASFGPVPPISKPKTAAETKDIWDVDEVSSGIGATDPSDRRPRPECVKDDGGQLRL
jgi:hypothetical protein